MVIQGPRLLPSRGSCALLEVLEVLGKGAGVGDLMAQSGVAPIPLASHSAIPHARWSGRCGLGLCGGRGGGGQLSEQFREIASSLIHLPTHLHSSHFPKWNHVCKIMSVKSL